MDYSMTYVCEYIIVDYDLTLLSPHKLFPSISKQCGLIAVTTLNFPWSHRRLLTVVVKIACFSSDFIIYCKHNFKLIDLNV